MIGDVVGLPGLEVLERHLPALIKEHSADFVLVNGENVAEGFGITAPLLERIFAAGADMGLARDFILLVLDWDLVPPHKLKQTVGAFQNALKETRTTKKHITPDTMAIMYWLNNRSRKTSEWSQRQDVNLSFGDDSIREAVRELTLDEARAKLAAIRAEKDAEET